MNETTCPLCGGELHEKLVYNSLSRVDNETYICNQCGQVEALQIRTPSWNRRREVLYFDEVAGIALVTEGEPGYYPLFPHPAAAALFCRGYVDAANEKLGYSHDAVCNIVSSSMAAQGLFS